MFPVDFCCVPCGPLHLFLDRTTDDHRYRSLQRGRRAGPHASDGYLPGGGCFEAALLEEHIGTNTKKHPQIHGNTGYMGRGGEEEI